MGRRRGRGRVRGTPIPADQLFGNSQQAAANDEEPVVDLEAQHTITPEPSASADALPKDSAVNLPTEEKKSSSPKADELTASYTRIKQQGWLLSFFSAPSPSRLEALSFIASIEENTTGELANAEELFMAACLHVMLVIEQPYLNAWFFNDPSGSDMYTVLNEKVGEKTNEEKSVCLIALKDYLQDADIQEKVKFGGQKAADVLSHIAVQIESLKEKTPTPVVTAP